MISENNSEFKMASRNFSKISYIISMFSVVAILSIILINLSNKSRISQVTAITSLTRELSNVEHRYYNWRSDRSFFYDNARNNIILNCIPNEYDQVKNSIYDPSFKHYEKVGYFIEKMDKINDDSTLQTEIKLKRGEKLVDSFFEKLGFAHYLKNSLSNYFNVKQLLENNWEATAVFIIENRVGPVNYVDRYKLRSIYLNEDNPESSVFVVLTDLLVGGKESPENLEHSIKNAKDYIFKRKQDLSIMPSNIEMPFGNLRFKLDIALILYSAALLFLFYLLSVYNTRIVDLSGSLFHNKLFFGFPIFYSVKDPFNNSSYSFDIKNIRVYWNQIRLSFPWLIFLLLPVVALLMSLFTKSVEVWNFDFFDYHWYDYLKIIVLCFVLIVIIAMTSDIYRTHKVKGKMKAIFLPLVLLIGFIYKLFNEDDILIFRTPIDDQVKKYIININFPSVNHLVFLFSFYLLIYFSILYGLKKGSITGLLLIVISTMVFTLERNNPVWH